MGSGDANGEGLEENVGEATFELMAVPTGVGCVRITVVGANTVTKDFTLAAGASTATLNMARLPLGAISVDGAAYSSTCGNGSPIYLADKASAFLQTGVVTSLALTFRKNNPVNASVDFIGNIQALSAGYWNTGAIIDGQVYTWGGLNRVQVPTPVTGLSDAIDLAVSGYTDANCAVRSNRTLACWSGNATPAAPGGTTETGFTSVAQAGQSSCAYKGGPEETWCWGSNGHGQYGNDDPGTATPVMVAGASQAVSVGAHFMCRIDNELALACAGGNFSGQLGNGTSGEDVKYFVHTQGPFVDLTTGYYHACAITPAAGLKCWGDNDSGQLGDGTITDRYSPVTVPGLSQVVDVKAALSHTCAVSKDGTLRCWGLNDHGQLGDGTLVNRLSPIVVPVPGKVKLVATGFAHTCAVTEDQNLYCWGFNTFGQIGDDTSIDRVSPVRIALR